MVASECAPVAKVGGLADVVFGLSRELEIRGNAVEIILPKYDCMRYDHVWGMQVAWKHLAVPWGGGGIDCTVWFGFVHGRKCFFIEPHCREGFFERGAFYGFSDEADRFAFFTKAALEFMLKSDKRPDIIHTHDWQTALLPVLLYEVYAHAGMPHQRVCHTIHNFKHQGVAGSHLLWAAGLLDPGKYMSGDRLGDDFDPNTANFTKGAIAYSNFVTTVSPHHAWEARHSDQGHGLGHALFMYQDKFRGVLNGIDYEMWNPEIDRLIAHPFTAAGFEFKRTNTVGLRHRLMLQESEKPVIAYVGRLDPQKGLHLIRHALFHCIHNGAQFVLLGSGSEHAINHDFHQLKYHLNENPDCHLEIGYNEELAHLVYAGADFVIVPSAFEPCGLTQMIAMRYGTVPVVRSVGGLRDTVFDWDHSDRPRSERNGFLFEHLDARGIESALDRALGLWHGNRAAFEELATNCMACDYSWNHPGREYVSIYEHIRHK